MIQPKRIGAAGLKKHEEICGELQHAKSKALRAALNEALVAIEMCLRVANALALAVTNTARDIATKKDQHSEITNSLEGSLSELRSMDVDRRTLSGIEGVQEQVASFFKKTHELSVVTLDDAVTRLFDDYLGLLATRDSKFQKESMRKFAEWVAGLQPLGPVLDGVKIIREMHVAREAQVRSADEYIQSLDDLITGARTWCYYAAHFTNALEGVFEVERAVTPVDTRWAQVALAHTENPPCHPAA